MTFLRRFLLTSYVFLFLVMPSVLLFAQTEQNTSARLDDLAKELDSIKQEQEKILRQQDETIEALKNLKIWARR